MASGAWSGTIVENFTAATLTAAMAAYSTTSGTLTAVPINGGIDMIIVGIAA